MRKYGDIIFMALGLIFTNTMGILAVLRHKDLEELLFGIVCLCSIPLTFGTYYFLVKFYAKRAK